MAATMERFVAVVKQYPGQQQVDLSVEIEVPGGRNKEEYHSVVCYIKQENTHSECT